jgi:hypothetical protein
LSSTLLGATGDVLEAVLRTELWFGEAFCPTPERDGALGPKPLNPDSFRPITVMATAASKIRKQPAPVEIVRFGVSGDRMNFAPQFWHRRTVPIDDARTFILMPQLGQKVDPVTIDHRRRVCGCT